MNAGEQKRAKIIADQEKRAAEEPPRATPRKKSPRGNWAASAPVPDRIKRPKPRP